MKTLNHILFNLSCFCLGTFVFGSIYSILPSLFHLDIFDYFFLNDTLQQLIFILGCISFLISYYLYVVKHIDFK